MYKGYYENGRRYQNVSSNKYFQPSDDKQFEANEAAHMLCLILDSTKANPLFRSPISSHACHILDVGTGSGAWALDTADRFPESKRFHEKECRGVS